MENLSDTYHDPSHSVPGIFYWNADHPKKNEHFQKFRGWLLLGRPMSLTKSNLPLGGSPSGISGPNPPSEKDGTKSSCE